MKVDHIFIFSVNEGKEAEELKEFGLLEGSNRIHSGQGTRNRKFYFDNFFFEILWVHDIKEIQNEITAPIRLLERANHQQNGYSPFGLCLAHTKDIDNLFNDSITYKPTYLPEGLSFDVITNENDPYLPWTCRLPDIDMKGYTKAEPLDHPVGIRKLTGIRFGIPKKNYQNKFTAFFQKESKIAFQFAKSYQLMLEFDNKINNQNKEFTQLPLSIAY